VRVGPTYWCLLIQLVPSFLAELRNLAVNSHAINIGTMSKMKMSPILLGIRRQKASKTFSDKASLAEWDEEGWEDLHDLRKPSEIVIADDTNAYQLFGDSIFAAPQEDFLESAQMILLKSIVANYPPKAFMHCSDRAA